MGIFGKSEAKLAFEEVKDEYRTVKLQIEEYGQQLSRALDRSLSNSAPKFEYLLEEDVGQDRLNALGMVGWELTGLASYTIGWGVNGNSAMKVHMQYALKRPIAEVSPEAHEIMVTLERLQGRRAELAGEIERYGYDAL